MVGAVPLNGIAPGDNVPLIVPEPVTEILIGLLPPLQIVAVPLIAAVGRALTFIERVPVKSLAIEVHDASVKVAIE